nr:coat protein [wheat closterovirus 1]
MAAGAATITLESAVISDEKMPNETEKAAADAIVKKHVMDNCSVMDNQWNVVKGLILHALAIRSTSKKVTKSNDKWIVAKVGTSDITIGDSALIAALNSATCLARFENRPRAWGRCNEGFYIDFFNQYKEKLPSVSRGIEGGLQGKHAVAAADFLVTGSRLGLEEQAALAHYRRNKLDTTSTGAAHNPVNLFQLGGGK